VRFFEGIKYEDYDMFKQIMLQDMKVPESKKQEFETFFEFGKMLDSYNRMT